MVWSRARFALCLSACSDRVLRASACDRRVWSCATQERALSRTAASARSSTRYMQKERPGSVKVRPITAIERAASLSAAVRVTCTTADDRTVRLWPCASRLCSHACRTRVIMHDPRCHSHGSSWLAAWCARHGRAQCPCARVRHGVRVARGRCWPAWRPSMWCAHDPWCCWHSVAILPFPSLALAGCAVALRGARIARR